MEVFLWSIVERQPYLFARSSDGFHVMHINTLSGTRDRLERMIDGSGLVKSHLLSQQMGKKAGVPVELLILFENSLLKTLF